MVVCLIQLPDAALVAKTVCALGVLVLPVCQEMDFQLHTPDGQLISSRGQSAVLQSAFFHTEKRECRWVQLPPVTALLQASRMS